MTDSEGRDIPQDDDEAPDFSHGMRVVDEECGEPVFAFRPKREQEIIAVTNAAKKHAEELEEEFGITPEDFC